MSDDAIDERNLYLINGCYCANISLYPAIPECIGCSLKTESCFALAHCCCKCGTRGLSCRAFGDAAFIQCGLPCFAIGCTYPSTCLKTQAQLMCLAANCACPPDREIPSAIALFGLTCYPKCQCGMRLSDAHFKGGGGGGPCAPDGAIDVDLSDDGDYVASPPASLGMQYRDPLDHMQYRDPVDL